MPLHHLKKPWGSTHRKKRVGRGQGSGQGKTAGRGGKGQTARTGNMNLTGFEGGQMPLTRRMPKFGFHNPFRKKVAVVNVSDLDRFADGDTVDPGKLREAGLLKGRPDGVKVLGDGELKKRLTVRAHAFSKRAGELIVKAGGTAEVIKPDKAPQPAPTSTP